MEHRDGHTSSQIQGHLCFPWAGVRRKGEKRSRKEGRKRRKTMTTNSIKRGNNTER